MRKLKLFTFIIIYLLNATLIFAQSGIVIFSAQILPEDITNLAAVDAAPGTGEAIITWITSPTSNVDTQRIEITGPQGPGVNFTTKDVPFLIIDGGQGPNALDNYSNYTSLNVNLEGLTIGETYTIRIVSITGALESPGAAPDAQIFFTPAPGNPPPVLLAEPATTPGTENTLYWTNGGIDDPLLECRLTASYDDFGLDPGAVVIKDSGLVPCPDSTVTYEHTFPGLISGVKYFYQVRTQHPVDGLSPYSNVESSQQETVGGIGGGGGAPRAVCGNAVLDSGEECDDGNKISGDGCSLYCMLEPAVCGNSLLEGLEECDDGNTTDGDGCSATCTNETVVSPESQLCGDGIVQAPEECDDGNYANEDGCSYLCEIEHLAPEEVVEVYLHITGAPEYRTTNYYNLPESERLQSDPASAPTTTDEVMLTNDAVMTEEVRLTSNELTTSDFGSTNVFRVNETPNLELPSELLLYKPSINNLDSINTTLDNFGEGWIAVEVIEGSYDFALNGESHNNRVLSNILIDATMDGEVIELDFTKAGTQKLIVGDAHDDNRINAFDIARVLSVYKATGANVSDFNYDEFPIVNAKDIAILLWNYKKTGEVL